MDLSAQNKEESDESEFYSAESDMEKDNIESDALHSSNKFSSISKKLNDADIQMVDNILDLNEKISLIYLLYDKPDIALDKIMALLASGMSKIVQEWCNLKKKNFQEKLLESLTIIQNYKALRKLGYKKDEMFLRFSPMQPVSLNVNKVRKCCYRVCENFDRENTEKFLRYIERDFQNRGRSYLPKGNRKFDSYYLEMYFLYLETDGYIALDDIHNISKIFKHMGNENLYDEFQSLSHKMEKENGRVTTSGGLKIDKTPGFKTSNEKHNNKVLIKNFNSKDTSDVYNIDPNCPGLLLIINNEHFYTEIRSEFLELLPPTDLKLEDRKGTNKDEIELKETFSKLGFKIITETDKIHEDMLTIIKDTVKHFKYSSLFIAILSHGDQGIVYGANSIPIKIFEVQQIMCQKHMSGIPKVLLLQSCQGSECQKIVDDDYETDSPKKYTPPRTTDLLTFRATIAGYGAVRHKIDGTWFIQTLCKTMRECSDAHFQDICTKVIKDITLMEWDGKCMVPIMETTFTKELYLKTKKD